MMGLVVLLGGLMILLSAIVGISTVLTLLFYALLVITVFVGAGDTLLFFRLNPQCLLRFRNYYHWNLYCLRYCSMLSL